ncbi:uncharacterized protein L3040_001287 [Drepanopeziza brunnea f. sp. 'multigermtubi']|uniref:uncharacterized protein n=1 Tax=Drepanopeziza brunnea f. sp. 'multigermtubi' TaxID=698441 RepID=UPI00238DCFA6|nr:hypothetical protein L3040_001287 [Drepanopeziza brunnea f. sp. 'multigermtubi']
MDTWIRQSSHVLSSEAAAHISQDARNLLRIQGSQHAIKTHCYKVLMAHFLICICNFKPVGISNRGTIVERSNPKRPTCVLDSREEQSREQCFVFGRRTSTDRPSPLTRTLQPAVNDEFGIACTEQTVCGKGRRLQDSESMANDLCIESNKLSKTRFGGS